MDELLVERADGHAVLTLNRPEKRNALSVALRDAISAIPVPVIEVHLSDPLKREPFRRTNYLSDVCMRSITGLGADGYILALDAAATL